MAQTRRLEVVIGGDSTGAERALRSVRTSTDDVGAGAEQSQSKLSNFGAAFGPLAIAGVAGIGLIGAKAVSMGSDLQESLSKTQTVFGGASGEVTGFADRMADAFGLPKQAMIDAATQIGLVGKASGLAEGDAANLGTKFAGLAADASSFYNVPLEEALGAIQSGLVGEAEPLRKYGVLLSEAAVQQKAVELGIAGVGQELTEGQKVQARAAIITEQMGDASGDLERTQGSLANRMRELQGRVGNMAAEFGSALIPAIQWALDIGEKWGGWLADHKPVLVAIAGVIGGALVLAIGAYTVSMASAAVATIAATWPILAIIAVIGALVAGIIWAYNNVDWFRTAVDTAWDAIQTAISWAWENVIKPVWEAISWYITNILIPQVQMLWSVIQVAWDIIQNVIKFAWENVIRPNWEALMFFINDVLLPIWSVLWSGIQTAWNGIVATIQNAWTLISAVFEWIKGGVNSVVEFISGIVGRVAGVGRGIADAIINGFKAAWNAVAGTLNAVIPDSIGFGPVAMDFPDNPIPTFHTGGVFVAPGGRREGLALLETGERIIPNGASLAATGGTVVNNITNVTVQGSVISERELAAIGAKHRARGGTG